MKILLVYVSLVFINIFARCLGESIPSYFRPGTFYPRKGQNDPRMSEVQSSGAIRDVIKRNSPRYRKVLVRNANSEIDFANEDCRYMTSRAKSKLDILGSLIRSNMGDRLYVLKAWTDNVERNDLLSLHYEGRAFKVRLSRQQNERSLSDLAKRAIRAGFDWVHFQDRNSIHISVVPDVCQTKLDLAVVVDTSGSVGYHNFQTIQRFLKDLIDFFNVGRDETHIALVSYSYSVKVEFGLTSYYSKSSLKDAINSMWYQGSNTRTGDALMALKRNVFKAGNGVRNDKSIPKIGILMTDGRSNGGTTVSYAANEVKKLGVNMFVIGITNNPRQSEINVIASQPVAKHYFKINGFNDLSSFVDQISSRSCDEGAQIGSCENADTVVDGGSFKYFRVELKKDVRRVSVEVTDIKGKSYLYVSQKLQNPGPLSDANLIQKSEQSASPRTISWNLPATSATNILYIAVQGQLDSNEFSISIWDSLFPKDRDNQEVNENKGAGLKVATARTLKDWNMFDYSIKSGSDRGYFTINKQTGVITTTRSLDREHIPNFQLSIVAQDRNEKCHKGLMVLDVIVKDENDNKPKFERSYTASVAENAPTNQYIIQVKATDKDTGNNAKLQYQISGPQQYKNVFRIDSNTGIVYTSQNLDYEGISTYNLELTVRDGGTPSLFDKTSLVIKVTDVNEPPRFTSPSCLNTRSCVYILEEEGNAGKQIPDTIRAVDPDTKQRCTLKYYLVSLDKQYFHIGETTGIVTTKVPLDRELKEQYSLDIEVRDCGRPQLSARTTIRVQASDINDNKPVFPYSNPLKISVAENFPLNQGIYTFKATDADKGINAQIEYTISDNKGNDQLAINKNNGRLLLVKSLDRERKSSHVIIVTAMDKGKPNRLSSSIEVQIKVEDVNDNTPSFEGSRSARVNENVRRGTRVMTVVARDADEGFNSKIQYSIVSGNAGNMFRIGGNSGVVTTNNIPDREDKDLYSLRILAQDFGKPSLNAEATYTVTIGDMNDNAPVFGKREYVKTIKENQKLNTEILKVSSTDRDIGINAEKEFILEKGHDDLFVINKNTGSIRLVKPLDFGTKNYYEFRVRSNDQGTPLLSGWAVVKITISDSNDFDPKFSQSPYNVNLEENVKRGHRVVQVKATDQDNGPSGDVVYSITKQDAENRFYIDSNSGTIYTYGSIDYERKKSYTVTVEAIDNGKPQRSASNDVNINIIDLNDNVPSFDNTPFAVEENHTIGAQIIQLKGSDKDSGKNAEFFFTLETSNTPFVISSNGAVSIKSALDREQTDSYALTVRITDRGTKPSSLSARKVISINIIDINDNQPKFPSNPLTCTVPENSPTNTFVCRTTASDRDIGENAQITYSLTGDKNFKINGNTGEIHTTKLLDRESKDSYSLVVKATDNGNPKLSSSATVKIMVTDVNDNQPLFDKNVYKFNIDEEIPGASDVGELVASDKDIGKNAELTYSIVKGHIFGFSTMFSIKKMTNNKVMLVANRLDREERDHYTLTVRVEDAGNPRLSSETNVMVVVKDINDNNPVLMQENYNGKVKENVGINTLILKLEATDRDIGLNAEVAYTFTAGVNQSHFKLDANTGELRTAKRMDYEGIKEYQFDVQAQDKGNPKRTDTAKVTIDILNVDDNAPEFEKVKLLELPEDLGVGQPCVQFKARDKDGSDIKYSITGGNKENKFQLDENTALLSVKNPLDRETTDKYNLTVSATDSSTSTNVYVPVKILDVNDNKPIFERSSYTTSVQEDYGSAQFISPVLVTVKATDRDLGKNAEIEYLISSGNVGDKFQIASDTGVIRATGKLDREQVSSYDLIITAKDKGTPSLDNTVSVKIIITDVNDNRPQFEKSSYVTSIYENTSPNSKLFDIRASDSDEGLNGRVGYKIKSGDSKTFNIDPTTGELKTVIEFDRETTSSYKLVIEATDFGKPSLSSTVDVSITILDINDNTPVIKRPIQIKPVNESAAVGFNLGQIIATDSDSGVNKELVYGLIEEGNNDFFSINANTGLVTLKKKVNRETMDKHNLKFTVKDKGVPVLSTVVDHMISILDDNDNAPKFQRDSYVVSLDEESTSAITLLTAVATDRDINENAVIVYTLVDDKEGVFKINSQTGVLQAVKPINYEKVTSYDLQIRASDWKFDTTINTKITVRNINDNSPVFGPNSYKKTIPEKTARRTVVLKVSANDPDPFGNLVYTIKSGESQPFEINSRTGEIYVVGELDREMKDNYRFVVRAADNGKPMRTADASVEITLSDINDNRPTFTKYEINANVTENEKSGKVIATVKADDRDIGKNKEIRYRVTPGKDDSELEIGEQDGVIKTKKVFDREMQTEAEFIFQAYDLGNPSLTSQDVILKVKIFDKNDNTPTWMEKDFKKSIEEHAVIGTPIKTIIATDPDEGGNGKVTYSIKEDNAAIAIDSVTGLITVSKDIDRETTPSLIYTLVATDNGKTKQHSSTTTITITVLDINDNDPVIKPPFSGSVPENRPGKTTIMKILADDKDIGENAELSFRLDNYRDLFTLEEKSGILKTKKPLDREEKSRYYLTIVVKDAGTPSRQTTANITIIIKDEDDNCPVFERTEYETRLEENAQRGTHVVTVKATDRDEGTNADLDYGILEGNDKSAFTVNAATGEVTVVGEVNKESGVDKYFIKVRAGAKDCGVKLNDSDVGEGGKPQTSNYTYAIVWVTVDDVNDNAPVFINGKDKIMYDNINETYIYRLEATDEDEGEGGKVRYELRGQIQKLSANKEIEYNITVRAYDKGIKPLFTDQTIIVVSKFQCDAMKFSIDDKSGVINVQTLCTVQNKNAGTKQAVLSSDITLTCTARGNAGPIIYQWTKDGDVVSIEDEKVGELILEKVNQENEGSYSCVARNAAGSLQSESTNIIVLEPPMIIFQPKSITVGQQEKFTLEVSAHGKPEPTYQWYKNNKKYDGGTSNKFQIDSAILADSAEYHCVIENGVGEAIETNKVVVKVFDQTTVVKVNIKVNKYDPKLKCHHFFPEDFEKTASGVVTDRVLVTKVKGIGNPNITICNRTACSKNPCKNDGECSLSGNGGYQCLCKAAWTGTNCENDVNECELSSLCTDAGTCRNLNGSFACKCPAGFSGRRCEYKKDACKPFPCKNEENCVPTEQGGFSCVKKSNEVTLVIDSKKLLGWDQNKKQSLEHFLNQILKTSQKATPITFRQRRRRDTSSFDFGDCTIHVIQNKIINSTKTEVKLALDCGNETNNDVLNQVCSILLKSSVPSTAIEQCGTNGEMKKAEKPRAPSAEAEINIVVEKPDGKALGAKEATDLLKSKDFSEKVSKGGNFEIEGMKTAYPSQSSKKGDNNTMVIVIAIIAVVVVVAVVAGFVIYKRRGHADIKQSHMMSQRSVMTHAGISSTELVPRVEVMSSNENMAYEGNDEINTSGTFMFEMPTGLKSSNAPEKKEENVLDIGYYHGNMSAERAENLLSQCSEAGTFILYTNPEQHLTFAVCTPGGLPRVRQFSLKKSNGRYTAQPGSSAAVTFNSITLVMEHYSVHAVSFEEDTPDIVLKEPLLKSAL